MVSSSALAFIQNLAGPDMLVIGIIALLVFGKRLPEVGRSLGRGLVEFKRGLHEMENEVKGGLTETPSAPPTRPNLPASPETPPLEHSDPPN